MAFFSHPSHLFKKKKQRETTVRKCTTDLSFHFVQIGDLIRMHKATVVLLELLFELLLKPAMLMTGGKKYYYYHYYKKMIYDY